MRIPIFLKSNLPVQKQSLFCFNIMSEVKNEMYRRKIASDGHEIIDKATFHKLTNKFRKNGGHIIQDEQGEEYLKSRNAAAIFWAGDNTVVLRREPTVSEVAEEMFHAQQHRSNRFGVYDGDDDIIRIKREIEAQRYLLNMKDKLKIPLDEHNLTLHNLSEYRKELKKLTGKDDIL